VPDDDDDLKSLQDAIYREKVERARRMTVSERLAEGLPLFEEAMGRMKIGIRLHHPDADQQEIDQLLLEQMDRLRAWQERDLYKRVESAP